MYLQNTTRKQFLGNLFTLRLFLEKFRLFCFGSICLFLDFSRKNSDISVFQFLDRKAKLPFIFCSVNAYDERSPLLHNHNDTHNDHERSRYGSGANESLASLEAPDDVVGHEHRHDHGVAFVPHSTIRSLILLIALSFHSIFEGLAIGLQQDLGQLISLFIAVIAHKAIMAFSLGLTLAQATLSAKQYVMSIMVFSLASPFGMGIGILLADMDHSLAADVANGILQGIAGGTFLYITFFEVLPHEFNEPKHRMLKLVSMLVGYSCICGLLFVTH